MKKYFQKTCKRCKYYKRRKKMFRNRFEEICELKNISIFEAKDICENFKQKKVKINKEEAKIARKLLKVLWWRKKIVTSEMSDDYIGDIIELTDIKQIKKVLRKISKMGFVKRAYTAKTLADYYHTEYSSF